jgi:NADH:ubiquinone oxidoreductase subunit C
LKAKGNIFGKRQDKKFSVVYHLTHLKKGERMKYKQNKVKS